MAFILWKKLSVMPHFPKSPKKTWIFLLDPRFPESFARGSFEKGIWVFYKNHYILNRYFDLCSSIVIESMLERVLQENKKTRKNVKNEEKNSNVCG